MTPHSFSQHAATTARRRQARADQSAFDDHVACMLEGGQPTRRFHPAAVPALPAGVWVVSMLEANAPVRSVLEAL